MNKRYTPLAPRLAVEADFWRSVAIHNANLVHGENKAKAIMPPKTWADRPEHPAHAWQAALLYCLQNGFDSDHVAETGGFAELIGNLPRAPVPVSVQELDRDIDYLVDIAAWQREEALAVLQADPNNPRPRTGPPLESPRYFLTLSETGVERGAQSL